MTTMKRSLSSWLSWSSWMPGRTRQAPERRRSEDCADYGTAFGLDMSFGALTQESGGEGDQDRRDRQPARADGEAPSRASPKD
ncbi:hypothetical protein [Sphaerotilus uruguayifluvii]|nr:hypothetical protein [Leptothrix sp. C29]